MNAITHTWRRAALAATVTGITAALLAASTWAVPSAAASPPCRTSQLTLWIGLPGSGAAGSTYYELEFSNTSPTTCTLFGYPGVSAVGVNGRQLGSAAARDRAYSPTTVTLAPGVTAHAVLRVTNADIFAPAVCRPTTATGLMVYPPNQRSAVTVAFPLRACTTTGPTFLTTRVVRPGTGIPGYSQ